MRPYLFHHTWIDLDHVLAITPSNTVAQVGFDMAFTGQRVWIDYWGNDCVEKLLAEWKGRPSTGPGEPNE